MPRGNRKRSQEDYEREIEEAAKRMKKYPEHLKTARDSSRWNDFLTNVVGVDSKIVDSRAGSKFWQDVREKIYTKQVERRSIYQEAREAGMPAKLARRIRDWSKVRAEDAILKWKATY